MVRKRENKILESEIEDALVTYLDILKDILNIKKEIRLIARQLQLPDEKKRLDILLTVGDEIFLIELKVESFKESFIEQVLSYKKQLVKLQEDKKLVSGRIISLLLVTDCKSSDIEKCRDRGIRIFEYSPINVLKKYFERMASVATFMKIRPVDLGVFNVGLINRIMEGLENGRSTLKELSEFSSLTTRSVDHHLKFAIELGLAIKRKKRYFLTDLGLEHTSLRDDLTPINELSEKQATLLRENIASNPFSSSVVFGIYTIVESAFFLSRNSYPIKMEDLKAFFLEASGKRYEWKAKKSLSTATYSYLNYSTKLGLLGKIGKNIVITPTGFRFILMLQLYKSIEMIEPLTGRR